METRKDKYVVDYKAVFEQSTLKARIRDPEFWKEYFQDSWRLTGVFALFLVASNYDTQEGLLKAIEHTLLGKSALVLGATFFLSPAILWFYVTAFFKVWDWIDRLRGKQREP